MVEVEVRITITNGESTVGELRDALCELDDDRLLTSRFLASQKSEVLVFLKTLKDKDIS